MRSEAGTDMQPRGTTAEVDLHGFHPHDDELFGAITDAVQRAWEEQAESLRIIHGHGRARIGPTPFANTNTGYLGMTVRRFLRGNSDLRPFIYAKIDVSHDGSTRVRLKPKKAGD